MLIKIAIVVSMCANVNMQDVAKKKAEIESKLPHAKVTVRFDKKCLTRGIEEDSE